MQTVVWSACIYHGNLDLSNSCKDIYYLNTNMKASSDFVHAYTYSILGSEYDVSKTILINL